MILFISLSINFDTLYNIFKNIFYYFNMNNLKFFRNKLNLKQSDIAEKIGIPRATYQSYENGRNEPNIKTLILLADVFGVSVDSLIEHNADFVDLRAVSHNQRLIVETVVNKLTDEQIAKVVGYIDSLK